MINKLLKYICPHTWFARRVLYFYGNEKYCDLNESIIESSKFKREWVKKRIKKHNEKLAEKDQTSQTSFHRCLGFTDIQKKGLIIKSEIEFAVETTDNDDDLKIHFSDGSFINKRTGKDSNNFTFMNDIVGVQEINPWGANPNLFKIQTSWFLDCPKDIEYLIIPIPYPDDRRFMACSGIQDPITSRDLTLFFWWYPKNSYEIVRKGTPLAQLIPIHKNKIYDSFKVEDEIPVKIQKKHDILTRIIRHSKCPRYSIYNQVAKKINE